MGCRGKQKRHFKASASYPVTGWGYCASCLKSITLIAQWGLLDAVMISRRSGVGKRGDEARQGLKGRGFGGRVAMPELGLGERSG
jgi:hypothetical protein